jgi:phosphohistidine phosphatase
MTTAVLLIRHAKPQAWGSFDDDLRPISDEGRLIQKKMGEFLKAKGYKPDAILHSPLLRAKETAQVLSEVFNISLEETAELGFVFNQNALLEMIPENKTLFMVGHAPSLGHFANLLTGKPCIPGEIERSGVIVLEFDDDIDFGKAKFVHYYSPANI